MTNKRMPLIKEIKEYHMSQLIDCLECIDKYAFNRDKQKDCILNLYPNKKEKSVEHRDKSIFRGMVIPSLRYLGLIIGYGDFIRVSANGKLLIESQLIDHELHQRVLRAVIYEIDKNKFYFIDIIRKFPSLTVKEFFNLVLNRINAFSERSKKDRMKKWLSILKQVKLIESSSQKILMDEEAKMCIDKEKIHQVLKDIDVSSKNRDYFERYFFNAYFELSKGSAGIVDIVDLREKVSINMLRENKVILTENQFDGMLKNTPFETAKYIISLGKPMGAQEKLFEYKGDYFGTLFIKTRKREVAK